MRPSASSGRRAASDIIVAKKAVRILPKRGTVRRQTPAPRPLAARNAHGRSLPSHRAVGAGELVGGIILALNDEAPVRLLPRGDLHLPAAHVRAHHDADIGVLPAALQRGTERR